MSQVHLSTVCALNRHHIQLNLTEDLYVTAIHHTNLTHYCVHIESHFLTALNQDTLHFTNYVDF